MLLLRYKKSEATASPFQYLKKILTSNPPLQHRDISLHQTQIENR